MLDSLVQQALVIAKYVVPIVLGYAAGWALKRRPPGFLFTAVVVVLVFFVAANAAAVVLRNIGVFLALSILYSLALVFITAVLGSFLNRPEAVGAEAGYFALRSGGAGGGPGRGGVGGA